MKNITLNLGGELAPGDVVGVSYMNCIVFGWYVESGQYGSLKFIPFRVPKYVKDQYDAFVAGNGLNNDSAQKWLEKKYSKGLLFKHMSRDFITSFGPVNNRAFKVSNPEEFFKGAGDTEILYLEGKTIMNNLKFPAK